MTEDRSDSQEQPPRRNIVVGKAQGEWGDTLPGATQDVATGQADEAPRTATTHPPIIGIEVSAGPGRAPALNAFRTSADR